ncbi:MAG TPA: MarC family protein [Polyangiaceae bacterium LLY-WYZ-15_(1-7)]|mgnify:CR=1 FL=1|nr:MarC family transcriptional regulator [Myxococcales bacterium]MAT28706.1 MarC family transcriptional regulator [Sandaracinus sp.]HJL02212.1 MarC family protein [Polyangiaceae bacterium LLY-WYZ-15_(1-7)]MBJ69855.1 MarC family transcriptional regulator [Sandaracinus sp.]HJL13292.1 MarC family protein [Polyangiaceae bacterium LLY-WYZ-15_(1-7)]
MPALDSTLAFALTGFSTLFAIVDPVGNVGPFLGVTADMAPAERKRTAARACLLALGVLAAFTAGGRHIFAFFGISMPAFQIAGGLLLFLVALEMLRAHPRDSKGTTEEREERRDDVAIMPLGIPLIAGPGAIASVILLASRAETTFELLSVYGVVLVTVLATYLVFRVADRLARVLGRTGVNVVTRLFGLLLAAIAVQFVLDGGLTAWRG